MTPVYTMLVLTEDTLTEHDVQRLAGLHDPDPVRAHVVMPSGTDQSVLDQLVDDIARVDLDELSDDIEGSDRTPTEVVLRARRHLVQSVTALNDLGVTSDGELVPDHPIDRVAQLAQELDVDEVVVITEPHLVTDALRRDWATQLRHRLRDAGADRPVLHFIAGTDQVVH
jgi:hypothetical protein